MNRPDWTLPCETTDKLDLSNNVCIDTMLPNLIRALMCDFTARTLTKYPNEYNLYSELSNYHNTNPYNIAIGFGLGELLQRIYQVWSDCEFAIHWPGWIPAEVFLKANNIPYFLTDKLDNNADILYLANPNGVTGKLVDKNDILKISKDYKLIIVDEAYMDFADNNQSLINQVPYLENIIVLKTLSKSIACPGLRFGYAISNKEITEKIQDIRPCYVSNALTNTLVPGLLKEISAHTRRMIETRDFIESNFNTEKSYGNFVLFNDFPAPLKDKVFTRLTGQQLHRMSLVNLTLFNSWL